MAKNEFVLNIGDDNVVLTRLTDGKVANAWLGSPDPAMAHEELGEALAEEPKARVSVLIDTLDQSFKDEEIPRVSILDRRKVLARHINMAFPGANLRGARLVTQTPKKTLIYELASVPLDGRIPGWLDFVQSLPNEKGGIYSIASENIDLLAALGPKDAGVEEGQNHWRHLIGVNVTGGLRQIIEKNGRLSLTRLTQAPPPETPPDEFADMIARDFKATITYIRRLGYQVGEPLDLVVLTSAEYKAVLEDLTWDGARSVSVYTPYEAGAILGLGSLGREDQAYSDVLHAAWFGSKKKPQLPLSRTMSLGDTKDDLREVAFLASPYAAGLLVAGVIGWSGLTGYELYETSGKNEILQMELNSAKAQLQREQKDLAALPYAPDLVRNVISVADALDAGKIDIPGLLVQVGTAMESDATVTSFEFKTAPARATAGGGAAASAAGPSYSLDVDMRLSALIGSADEAVQTARVIEQRLGKQLGGDFKVVMTTSPVAAQAAADLSGGFGVQVATGPNTGAATVEGRETFYAAYKIERALP